MITRGLPGFRDFPPEEFALRAHIFRVWREVAARYGFQEYDGPPLESLELYTGKSGDEIVAQLYSFTDKGDREVALRPEMTPTLARMIAAHGSALKKPIRWFSIPQLFRYERQQRGRLREHFQLNCDLIGEASPLADAEVIALAIDVMRGFGLGPADVRVRLSDRRVMHALLLRAGVAEASVAVAFQAIDRVEKDPDGARELLAGSLGVDVVDEVLRLTHPSNRAETLAAVADDAALRPVMAALDDMGLGDWIEFDPTIVRGLAYYTGTVFELFDARRTLRAICGGGRYDSLLASTGGPDLPALGFGMGDVVLGELLKDRGLHPAVGASIDVFVVAVTNDDIAHALRLAHELRSAGARVEYSLTAAAVGKQLTLANARGAKIAIVIGPDDRARGEVQMKDLTDKSQQGIARTDVVASLLSRLSFLDQRTPANG